MREMATGEEREMRATDVQQFLMRKGG